MGLFSSVTFLEDFYSSHRTAHGIVWLFIQLDIIIGELEESYFIIPSNSRINKFELKFHWIHLIMLDDLYESGTIVMAILIWLRRIKGVIGNINLKVYLNVVIATLILIAPLIPTDISLQACVMIPLSDFLWAIISNSIEATHINFIEFGIYWIYA